METMPPPQKKRRTSDEYIPTELLEKILLNLPVKSLTRFSSASKSWNSTIHSPDFARRYRGREMIVFKPLSDSDTALDSPLSSILSSNPMTSFPRPLLSSRVRASCGELWCVEFEDNSVCLYNPSMRTCRKLPASSTRIISPSKHIIYGLGYDSVTNDYKILKFYNDFMGYYELYSKRSDSWRKLYGLKENIRMCMSSLPSLDKMGFESEKGVFVNGLLHWILILHCGIICKFVYAILSFDLSTEKYGEVTWPVLDTSTLEDSVELCVLRGKLSLYSHSQEGEGVIWVHDEGLWTKEVVINYSLILPEWRSYMKMKPLYSYRNNIKAFDVTPHFKKILLYEDESMQLVDKSFGCSIFMCFTYVESMVKP